MAKATYCYCLTQQLATRTMDREKDQVEPVSVSWLVAVDRQVIERTDRLRDRGSTDVIIA